MAQTEWLKLVVLDLFLVDGSPQGLITAEIMNWTEHVLTRPRTKLAELVQSLESSRTGLYLVVGSDFILFPLYDRVLN